MRLLNVHTLEFGEFHAGNTPRYAIASHILTGNGREATINDVRNEQNTDSYGFQKIRGFAKFVRDRIADVEWLWMNTCCTDPSSDVEVREAAHSTFRWCANAEVCLALLEDVEDARGEAELRRSEWFHRGWTLQELLAPRIVLFLTRKWEIIGHKGKGGIKDEHRLNQGSSLDPLVAAITGIPEDVLQDFDRSLSLSVEQRLTWMDGRRTSREEDLAYGMLGIFGASMTIIYGEGVALARKRLLRAISETSAASSSALEIRGRSSRQRRKIVQTTKFEQAHGTVDNIIELAPVLRKDDNGGVADDAVPRPVSTNDQPPPSILVFNDREAKSKASAIWRHFPKIRICFVLIALGFAVIGGSLAVGLYYSIARDRMGDGFTAAGWMTAVGTMVLAAPMAKHYPQCRCWNSHTRLLP